MASGSRSSPTPAAVVGVEGHPYLMEGRRHDNGQTVSGPYPTARPFSTGIPLDLGARGLWLALGFTGERG